jgi:hypothetical protein
VLVSIAGWEDPFTVDRSVSHRTCAHKPKFSISELHILVSPVEREASFLHALLCSMIFPRIIV